MKISDLRVVAVIVATSLILTGCQATGGDDTANTGKHEVPAEVTPIELPALSEIEAAADPSSLSTLR